MQPWVFSSYGIYLTNMSGDHRVLLRQIQLQQPKSSVSMMATHAIWYLLRTGALSDSKVGWLALILQNWVLAALEHWKRAIFWFGWVLEKIQLTFLKAVNHSPNIKFRIVWTLTKSWSRQNFKGLVDMEDLWLHWRNTKEESPSTTYLLIMAMLLNTDDAVSLSTNDHTMIARLNQ